MEHSSSCQAAAARKRLLHNTLIAAASNLSTAYNLVNIQLAHVEIAAQYCSQDGCHAEITTASTACLVGAIVGQLMFGYVGDCLGRGRALHLTMLLSLVGALASALAVPLDSKRPSTVFALISIARFLLGVGVGGVYPLSATIGSEASSNASRGRIVSLIFSMQGLGQLLVPLVGMALLYSLGTAESRAAKGLHIPGLSWRLILGLGALPGILLIPLKTRSAPTPAATPMASPAGRQLTLRQALMTSRYWPKLVGCAGGWFLFDITFYGNTLFAPTVLTEVFHTSKGHSTPTIGPSLSSNLCLQLVVLALIGLPGYYVAVYFMDKAGRKNIQLQGFVMMTLLYGMLSFALDSMKELPALLLIVYGLTYFFSNFGPNSTTFILPSETFPFEVRSSLNGVCAATGKLGAVVGSSSFKPLVHSAGTGVVFGLCAGCAVLGAIITAIFVEDRRGRAAEATSFMDNRVEPDALEVSSQHQDEC